MMNSHKLSIETQNSKVEISLPWDSSFDDYLNAFKAMMVAITFNVNHIDKFIVEHAEELKQNKQWIQDNT